MFQMPSAATLKEISDRDLYFTFVLIPNKEKIILARREQREGEEKGRKGGRWGGREGGRGKRDIREDGIGIKSPEVLQAALDFLWVEGLIYFLSHTERQDGPARHSGFNFVCNSLTGQEEDRQSRTHEIPLQASWGLEEVHPLGV